MRQKDGKFFFCGKALPLPEAQPTRRTFQRLGDLLFLPHLQIYGKKGNVPLTAEFPKTDMLLFSKQMGLTVFSVIQTY